MDFLSSSSGYPLLLLLAEIPAWCMRPCACVSDADDVCCCVLQNRTHFHPLPEVPTETAVTTPGCCCAAGEFEEHQLPGDGEIERHTGRELGVHTA